MSPGQDKTTSFLALRLALAAGALLCVLFGVFMTRERASQDPLKEAPQHEVLSPPHLVKEDEREAVLFPDEPAERPTSSLQVLTIFERTPVESLPLVLSRENEELQLLTDNEGQVPVPPGSWGVRTTDERHVLLSPTVLILPSQVNMLWVGRKTTLSVEVRGLDGAAIPGAVVSWRPRHTSSSTDSWARWETNSAGLATIADWVECPGTITAYADGMDLAEVSIQGPLATPLIRLFLRPSPEARELCITDSLGAPLEGVSIGGRLGDLGRSDREGKVALPSWVPLDEELLLKHAGHIEARAFAGQEDCVALPASATLHVIVVNAEGTTRISILPTEEQEHLLLPNFQVMKGGSGDFSVPLGMPLKLEVLDSVGYAGRAEVDGLSGYGEIRVVLSEPDVAIHCRSADGGEILGSIVVHYQETEVPIRASSSGVTWLPFPEKASMVRISSDSHESVSLRPVGTSAALPGTIQAALSPAMEHTLRILSGDAQPARGMRIGVWPQSTGIKLHPELNGGWPTGHPGWCLHRGRAYRGMSDSTGSWRALLPLGEYRVFIDVPEDYGTPESPSSLYLGQTKTIALTGAAETTLRVALPVFLSFDVFEETTRLPVPEVQVSGSVIPELPRRGNHWEGWVPDDTREITVVAPGVGSTRLWLPLNDNVVLVSPDQPGTVVVSNWPTSLAGSSIWVDLYERWGLNRIGSGKTRITPDATGTAMLFIPYVEVQDFGLEFPGYTFSPDIQRWEPGGTFTFEIKEAR